MSKSLAPSNFRVWLAGGAVLGFILLIAGCLGGLYVLKKLTRKTGTASIDHLDKTLGLEPIDGIEEDGFHGMEVAPTIWPDEPFRWTNGAAKLVVPLHDRQPQSVDVRLGLPTPRTVALHIRINGKSLFDEKVAVTTEWTRTFDTSEMKLGKELVIEILSDAHIPAEVEKNSTDPRKLGVVMRGITLHSRAKEFIDVPLGVREVPGVTEEGFYHAEKTGDFPFRWTNGKALLIVPIRAKTPTKLLVTLDAASHPHCRAQVLVNGRKLADEEIKQSTEWIAELPLAGVDLGKSARIEVISPTFLPAQTIPGSDDNRKLGVRVKRLILAHEGAAAAK